MSTRPSTRLGHDTGQVVITRFECRNLRQVYTVVLLHYRVKKGVRRAASGYVGGTFIIDWRRRTVLSLSVWTNLPSIYSMGDVPEHIQAVRIPRRIGVRTRCGVYGYSGDWRNVLFHIDCSNEEPIQSFASVRNRLSERSE